MSSYQVFARKYRPQTFDEVVGQEHITQTLKNAIASDRLAHAYLFVGPRGTGKTSTARILAKALNCAHGPTVTPCGECDNCREIAAGNSLDVMEIDGASNNGVEQVRELRDNVRFAPSHGKYKIYIIDEVHMLSTAAFNALLKTLEEPPAHVKFVFATTDVQKVLPTILSRCQRFDLRRIPAKLIAEHLQRIAENEKITLEPEAARAIAKGAEGGLRDAESMLDQLVAFCGEKISQADVLSVFGFTASQTVSQLCEHLLDGDASAALGIVQEQAQAGRDLSRLMADLIGHIRNLLVAKANPEGIAAEVGAEAVAELQAQADRLPLDRLLDLIEQFASAESRMKWVPNKKLHFEIAVIKAIQTLGQATLTEVLDTLTAIKSGTGVPAAQPRVVPRAAAPAPRSTPPVAKPAPVPEAPRRSLVAAFQKTAAAPAPEPAPEPVVEAPARPEPLAAPIAPAPKAAAPVSDDDRAPWEERSEAKKSEPESVKPEPVVEPAPVLVPEPEAKAEPEPVEPATPHTLSLFGDDQFPTPEAPTMVPEVKVEPEEEPEQLVEPEAQVAAKEPDREPVEEEEPEPEPAPESVAMPEPLPMRPEEDSAREPEQPEVAEVAEVAGVAADVWPQVIRHAREKRPLISSWMEKAAFRGIRDGQVVLAFPGGGEGGMARQSLEKPAQIQFLKEAFAHIIGQTVTIGFEDMAPGETAPAVVIPTEDVPVVDPMEEFKNDPLIRHALEVFKAEIQLG